MIKNISWWEYDYFLRDCEFLILGAGIVGLSTAIELLDREPDAKVTVIDSSGIYKGASTRNAGFACFGSPSELLFDISENGEELCIELLRKRYQGLTILKERIGSQIDYQETGGVELPQSNSKFEYYLSKLPYLNDLISEALGLQNCFSVQEGFFGREIFNRWEGKLNPMKMIVTNLLYPLTT